jgi:hypothetical protein
MRMSAPLLAAWLMAASPAASQEVARETFSVVGWNDACSVAVRHLGYTSLSDALQDEPVRARIGTITIPPGEETSRTVWAAEWEGAGTWQTAAAKKTVQDLVDAGYKRPGFLEDIREATSDLSDGASLSTATFGMRAKFQWPGGDWRWHQVFYSPLGDCGLFIFSRREEGRPFYRYSLLRLYAPSARILRAKAHLANSRQLFEAGDLEGALAEVETAARLQPELASTRYRHAALLCISGQLNESVSELGEAIRLDAKLARTARRDPDFSEVNGFPKFRALVGDKPDAAHESDEDSRP